jgi:hypothetical protein
MDYSRAPERKATVDEVVEFIEGAVRQERLREDIRALFGWLSELDSLEVASELAILTHARVAVAQAIKEERKGAAKLASQAPRVMLWAKEVGERATEVATAPEPPHAPPPGRPLPEPFVERAPRAPAVAPDAGSSASNRSPFAGLSAQGPVSTRTESPTVMAQADVDRLFDEDSEIQTNDPEVGPSGAAKSRGKAEK